MLLQSRTREILYSVISSVSGVLDCSGDILDVVVDLPFIGSVDNWVGANQVDQRLDALDKKSGLIFEVILQPVRMPA